ncbi:hypothetical protein E4U39_001498 [Claviceps sp. Clav50 group G5]|nr:hypothetical protein E4U39_001498 [Claviceps sp. Clav50 group G5]
MAGTFNRKPNFEGLGHASYGPKFIGSAFDTTIAKKSRWSEMNTKYFTHLQHVIGILK